MLYVLWLKWQPGLSREQRDGALARRAEWKYPDGVKVHGEYWPFSDEHAVVSVFETDDPGALMELTMTWGDVFEIEMCPAVDAEQGLRLGQAAMAKRMANA